MSIGTALVLIVLILALTAYGMQRAENRKELKDGKQSGRERELESERDAARTELQDLRERVKTLEKIATDPARRTAEEIEKLRD